eukprot:7425621-Pyramimonas_sp.AAC.1
MFIQRSNDVHARLIADTQKRAEAQICAGGPARARAKLARELRKESVCTFPSARTIEEHP